MNGHEVLRQLRLARIETPILILSGSDDTENKLKGFGFGADDYLTKPFHREELVARIHAIIRRSKGHSQSVIKTGKINGQPRCQDGGCRTAKPVHLTGKEYQMLELLSLRKGTTLTKEMFLNHLYGGMDEPELKIIDVFICKLRKKLSRPRVATITSKPSGAAAMCCVIPTRRNERGHAAGHRRNFSRSPLAWPEASRAHSGPGVPSARRTYQLTRPGRQV